MGFSRNRLVKKSLIYSCRKVQCSLERVVGFLFCYAFCFISVSWRQKLTLSHANSHRCSSRAVSSLTHISRLDISSQRYGNNTHLLLFITLPPLGSTCCDSIGGRLLEIATQQRRLIDGLTGGGRAFLLLQPFPVSDKILLFFSLIFFFLISFFIRCAFIRQTRLR